MGNEVKQFHIKPLDITVFSGDVVAFVGVKHTDVSIILKRFHDYDPISQYNSRKKAKSKSPTIQCIKSRSNLFKPYTAYENIYLTEKCLLNYSKKQLIEICDEIKRRYRISIDLNKKISSMTVSERIIVDLIRAYLLNADMIVLDNLISYMDFEYANVLISMIRDLRKTNKIILYLTTKWEDAIKFASKLYIVMDDVLLGQMSSEEVKLNPQHLIYLLSGRHLVEENDRNDETKEFLNLLNTGAEYLSNNYELKDALAYVSINIASILHAEKAIIYIQKEDSDQIHTFSDNNLRYFDELSPDFVRYRMEHDSPEDVFYSTFEDNNFIKYFNDNDINSKTIICIPISNKSCVNGLLQIIYSNYFVYDEHHLLYLKSFCKEISIILETSRLMGNSVLLKESNHRIKNNLQMIVNIISMQQIYIRKNKNCDVNAILGSILDRISSIASLHEFLTRNLRGDGSIDLENIIVIVMDSFAFQDVKIDIKVDDIFVPYSKATSISMVINEIITNIYKYAFVGRIDKAVSINCYYYQNMITMKISDNGVGLPKGFDINRSFGIGYSIIKSIVQIDLKGKLHITSNDEGTIVTMFLPLLI